MKEKIAALLERELDKLDKQSKIETEGLDINSVRRLDLLIKAYHNFIGPPPAPQETTPDAPETQSTEDLLKQLGK